MGSLFLLSPPCRALAHSLLLWQLLVLASAEGHENLIQNGNFEDVTGYYPAGVVLRSVEMNQNAAVKQWTVQESAIEIISSRLWPASTAESMYAVHLNSPQGPGAIQTEVNSNLIPGQTYLLLFDVASTFGGPSVKRLEVSLDFGYPGPRNAISKSFSFNFPDGNDQSKYLIWEPTRAWFKFRGVGNGAIVRFRSQTPGSRGLIVDNIKLLPTSCGGTECAPADMFVDSGNSGDRDESAGKSSLGLLKDRVMMTTETWFRQRFLRRADW
ncbi:hypothetical protein MPTK1_5g18790 [Marchantia polymorpha subsp. ruderalis]|uniref:DUF642 domain-containing protein n=2 Tax=Marchantia polymorpha TaxID=3197 RepID=A0AAF6BJV3_MARPO|nr:hypothetical protein MARPO_0073s0062 [Marchantia polymorpha]BBN12287.1 hypothetical protein Mp_5g18790 [Marchantia polymorpha subsp. ruderalis]|eukprot:PTQ35188.1 hypothetical protein MARPO_0073s0062 [Marchantia polymorpha]